MENCLEILPEAFLDFIDISSRFIITAVVCDILLYGSEANVA